MNIACVTHLSLTLAQIFYMAQNTLHYYINANGTYARLRVVSYFSQQNYEYVMSTVSPTSSLRVQLPR